MADYSSLLRDRVTLTCRSIDRIMQGYVPKLQSVGLVCRFLQWQRGFFVPSSAAGGVRQDRRRLRGQGAPVRGSARHPGGAVQETGEQGGRGPPVDRCSSRGGGL